jgi:hypothetical protein
MVTSAMETASTLDQATLDALQESVASVLAEQCGSTELHAFIDGKNALDKSLWAQAGQLLTEPIAVGYHAVQFTRLAADDVPLVIGCGPVGLSGIAGLMIRNVHPIIAADFSPGRCALALRMVAGMVIDPAATSPYQSWHDAAAPAGYDGSRYAQLFGSPRTAGTIARMPSRLTRHQSYRMRTSLPMQKCFTPICRWGAAWLMSANSTRGCKPFSMVRRSALTTSGWLRWPVRPRLIEKSDAPNCTMSRPSTARIASRSSTHSRFSAITAITIHSESRCEGEQRSHSRPVLRSSRWLRRG